MTSKIYKITNLINNKIYIGYTKENKEERKQYWISFYHSDDPQIGFNKKKVL